MAETKMQLADWLDDLCVRFIINLPQEELESVERICFQVEEAQWFYEDFIRPLDATLPSLPLRAFSLQMFRHCPLLASFSEYHHIAAFDEFLAYKTRVPVRGAILLDHAMDHALLVRGWKKGANWSFPRGKINKDEKDLDCAVREVYEETGYDIVAAGLVPDPAKAKYIEVTMREQHMKLYVFRGVPRETVFQPRTRKEISKIEWYKISQLPGYHKAKHNNTGTDHEDTLKANKFYMVAPFLQPLKKWIAQQRRNDRQARDSSHFGAAAVSDAADYYDTEENDMQKHLQYAQRVYDAYAGRTAIGSQQVLQQDVPAHRPPPQRTGPEAASELKRLLSVGQQPPPEESPNPPEAANAANLLAMLRQSGSAQRAPPLAPAPSSAQQAWLATQQAQYRNAFEPVATGFTHAQHPQYYQRLPEMSADNVYQPSFSSPPISSVQQTQQEVAMSSEGRNLVTANNNFAPIQARRPSRQNTTSLQQSIEKQINDSSQQAAAPYQRTGDPHFLQEIQDDNQQGPTIPAASDLPAPNLSNHAMNLLNVFKSTRTPTAPPGQPSIARPTVAEVAAMQTRGQPSQNPNQASMARPMGHRHSESRSRQALTQAFTAPNVSELAASKSPSAPPTKPPSTQQNLPQQSALLDLFRKPSQPPPGSGHGALPTNPKLSDLLQEGTPGPELPAHLESDATRVENQSANYLSLEPAELSALPSPGISTQKKQLFDPKDGTMKDHIPQPRVVARPSSSHKAQRDSSSSPMISATMTSPPNIPEFGTARRKARQSKQSVDQAEVVAREQEAARPNPIQILRRPASPPKESPTGSEVAAKVEPKRVREPENRRPVTPSASKPSQTPTTPSEPKHATPKPFQPQILRRPQQSPAAPSAPQFQRRTASPQLKSEPRSSDVSPAHLTSEQQSPPRVPAATSRPTSRANRHAQLSGQPTQPVLDRRSSNTAEQKQALLSLFGKPKTPASAAAATEPTPSHPTTSSAVSSPASYHMPSAAAFTQPAPPNNNIAPAQPQSDAPPAQASVPAPASALPPLTTRPPTSRSPFSIIGSPSAADADDTSKLSRASSVSQTPMSPGDRGFLLNFLEGFTKGPAQGQGQERR